jgi:hypothetical protein
VRFTIQPLVNYLLFKMADFGEIIETRYILSEEQLNASKFGFSEVFYSGSPTVYSPGDVVNLPYTTGETSTMNALGAAWAAYASGVGPA